MVSQETLDAIGAAVGDLATKFTGARVDDQGKFYELDFRLKAVEAQIRNFSSKGSDEKLKPMTARRAFSSIPKYGGSSKEYDSWKFQMAQFLAEDMDFPGLLDYIEKLVEEPDDVTMQAYQQRTGVAEDKLKWLTHQLFQVMSLNCVGDALSHVKSVKDDLQLRGVRVWWRLTQEWQCLSGQRLQGLVGRVFNPGQVKNIMEVTVAVERWEAWTKEYEESTGTKVPEVAKVYAIKQVMPAELQHDMQRLSSQIQTYKQARAYIMDQVLTRRDPWFGDEKKTKSGGPVPMELDALQKSQINGEHVDAMGSTLQHSNVVGDEQSDDTAELNALRKGGFPGKCHHCGQFGHKISECRKKDEEVAKKGGKGKGKNSWEYSAVKGNTYSWSPWWQGESPGKGWSQKGGHSWTSGKSTGKGSDSKGGKGGKGSKGMYWFDTIPENEWDWNGGTSTSSAMFSFEASTLPGPPGLPLRNRFQELVSDDESEDETDLQQQLPCCSATTTHDEKKILKVIPGVDVPMTPSRSFVNPLIAEPVDMDIHPLVSDRWCRTDTRSGWRKITTVMDSGAI